MEKFTEVEQVPEFLALEDWEEQIGELSKAQLMLIAEHQGIDIPGGTKKGSILLKVLGALKSDGDESLTQIQEETKLLADQAAAHEIQKEILELQLRLESERREAERERAQEKEKERQEKEKERQEKESERAREREREAREREKEEYEKEERRKDREHELEVLRLRQEYSGDNFNVNTALKLVPNFEERNVQEFFVAFEKLANRLKWPKEMWTTLLQSKLVGRAQKVYGTLNEDLSVEYETVKEVILRAYELVPEAYRQRFREFRKLPTQTYVEFARVKRQTFLEWLKSKCVNDFEKLQELILVEEFKSCLPREMKVHLEELKLDSLQEVAIASDEYALTHKSYEKTGGKKTTRWQSQPENTEKGSNDLSTGKGSSPMREGSSSSPSEGRELICYYCRQKGHVKSNCEEYKKFIESKKKPVTLLTSSSEIGDTGVPKGFEKYLSEGEVSCNARKPKRNVKILRDTGSLQSLILRASLPNHFREKRSDFVWISGFPNTLTRSPREKVFMNSKWSNGFVKLAVVDRIHVGGVDVVLGNDIADRGEGALPVASLETPERDSVVTKGKSEDTVCVETRSESQADGFMNNETVNVFNDLMVDWAHLSFSDLRNAQEEEYGKRELVRGNPRDLTRPVWRRYEGLLYRFSRDVGKNKCLRKLIIPGKYVGILLDWAHGVRNYLIDQGEIHFGFHKYRRLVKENFFWPGMERDISRYFSARVACSNKPIRKPQDTVTRTDDVANSDMEVRVEERANGPRKNRGVPLPILINTEAIEARKEREAKAKSETKMKVEPMREVELVEARIEPEVTEKLVEERKEPITETERKPFVYRTGHLKHSRNAGENIRTTLKGLVSLYPGGRIYQWLTLRLSLCMKHSRW